MADKGFDIKVLIPTDDGLTVSEKSFESALYYLMYNVSNRSYQLVGKVKQSELNKADFNIILSKENIDFIISNTVFHNSNIKVLKPDFKEINQMLNNLIDQIDQKKELI
jgi:hypothetical protein